MKYRKPLIGLSLFVIVSTVLISMVFTTLRRDVPGDTDTYSAVFTDASGLREGDDVRMAGVRVGRVEDVALDGLNAKATFRVQKGQTIYGNTVASVTYQNIVGQRYLGLSLGKVGNSAKLSPGSVIPLERTEPSFDIGLLLNGFEPLFSVLDPQKVNNLTTGVIQALQGDTDSITSLVEQTATVTETLAGRDEILGDVITGLSDVIANLAKQNTNLNTVLEQGKQMVTQLNGRRQELVSNVGSFAAVVQRLSAIAGNVRPQLEELVRRQPGFAKHFVDNEDQLAFVGGNLPKFLQTLVNISQEGAYANVYACDINQSVIPGTWQIIPQIVNAATPGGKAMFTPKCRAAE